MEHSFNVEVAKIVGVNAAVIFKNISHWCEKNRANNKHLYDGEYWTYNSIGAFESLFSYLSAKQIRAALDKLKENGFIDYGEYNQNPYDRTKWYCDLTWKSGLESFLSTCTKGQMDFTERANVHLYKRDKCIPDINTDDKHLNLITEKISVGEQGSFFSDDIEVPQNVSDKPKTGIKKARASEKKSQAHPAVNLIKKYWFEEFRKTDKPTTPSQWGMRVSKITSIVNKIIAYSTDSFKHIPSEEEILDIFKQVTTACSQSNSTFYQTIDLSNLESKFAGALTLTQIKIENKNTGYGKFPTSAQRVSNAIEFFNNL